MRSIHSTIYNEGCSANRANDIRPSYNKYVKMGNKILPYQDRPKDIQLKHILSDFALTKYDQQDAGAANEPLA